LHAANAAGRTWMLDAIASGALTLADIMSGSTATRALLSEAEGTLPRVRHRPMVLRLEILQSAVDDLCRLGWLDGADHRSSDTSYRRFKPIMALAMSSVLAFSTASPQTLSFVS